MANPIGRPPRFRTPQDMYDLYILWRKDLALGGPLHGEIPDVEGFCDYAGIWRDKLAEYEQKDAFRSTIKEIKNWMYYRKKQLAMVGKMNATVYIFDAKNNHNYVDKTENDLTTKGEAINGAALDDATLTARISALVASQKAGTNSTPGGTESAQSQG